MRIDQLMNRPVVTCKSDDTLAAAAQLMWDNDCGVIPVVDDGGVAGMITDRDICMAAYTVGRRLSEIPVAHAMSREVFSCHPDDTVGRAEQIMGDKQVRRLPVVDADQRVVGIVSMNDLARHSASESEGNGVLRSLAMICQPRGVGMQRQQRQQANTPRASGRVEAAGATMPRQQRQQQPTRRGSR